MGQIVTKDTFNSNEILGQLSDSILILDSKDKIMFFNQGVTRYQHLVRQRFQIGVSFLDIVSLEREEVVRTIIRQVRKSRKPLTSEAEYKDTTGRSYFFEVIYNPVTATQSDIDQICVLSREITHHKTFERKSLQLVQDLTNVLENANALIFSVDSREYVTEWNKECVKVTGNEKNEVFTQKIYSYLDDRSHQKFRSLVQKVLNGESVSNEELLVKAKAGEAKTVLINATPKLNTAKNVIGILIVGQDITELSEYRKSLEDKVKDRTEKLKLALDKEKELVEIKNRFVSVASHEFRIPLSSISGYVKSIQLNPSLRDIDHVNLEAIEKQVAHMKSLLDDILTIKKTENHALTARINSLEIVQFLTKLVEEVSTNSNHSHKVHLTFNAPQIEIRSDEKLLRNIFLNILSNAIKFSPSHPEVSVSVTIIDKGVGIKVEDRGIGISEEDLQKLFEPFRRGSNVSEIKGTGLGLYIARKAVEALKGEMQIQSEIHKGTTITISLPFNTQTT